MDQRSTVVGVFEERALAERAADALRQAGFSDDDIGFAVRDGARESIVTEDEETSNAGEGAVAGMVTGGLLGGVAAAAVSLLIPGIGPVLGGGLLAATLSGAAAGAAAGGLLGALTGLGVSEEEARYYESEFQAGRTILTVRADGRTDEAVTIMRRHGGYDMETSGDTARAQAYAAHPQSAAIQETATTLGAVAPSPAITRTPVSDPTPADMAASSTTMSSAGPVPLSQPPDPLATAQLAGQARSNDQVDERPPHTFAGERQEGPDRREMEDGTRTVDPVADYHPVADANENRDLTTDMRRAEGVAEHGGQTMPETERRAPAGAERSGAQSAQSQGIPTNSAMEDTAPIPSATARMADTRGESMTREGTGTPEAGQPLGKWPVRADDPHAGKLVEGEEQVSTTGAMQSGIQTGQQETRVPFANVQHQIPGRREEGAADSPYIDRGEDLERVGATSGIAPWARGPWTEASSRYRQEWEARPASRGSRWEDVESGYRYGHEMAADPRYQGREWPEVESNLGTEYRTWSERQGYQGSNSGWDLAKEYARESWNKIRGK
jgi:hypothetical protein